MTEDGQGCTGGTVSVGEEGTATLAVASMHALAIHVGAKVGIGLLRGCLRQQGISVRVKAELIQSWPKACDQVQFAFVQDHI